MPTAKAKMIEKTKQNDKLGSLMTIEKIWVFLSFKAVCYRDG
jgi:hypothetical protein